jgi:hypothetical protein
MNLMRALVILSASQQDGIGWFGLIGWIVGFVGTTVGVRSYLEDRRRDRAYSEILSRAERDWKGRYTEEQPAPLNAERRRLQDQIRREVPREARHIFLQDQQQALILRFARLL